MPYNIELFTDGASSGNPGPGGYGVVLKYDKHVKEISGGYRLTTNNRMELLAAIKGLEALKYDNCKVKLYSDSKYLVDAVEKKWLYDWEKKKFKKKRNPDLWIQFLKVYKKHNVKIYWIKGHSGHPENERCDKLAVSAANSKNLKIDLEYEKSIKYDN